MVGSVSEKKKRAVSFKVLKAWPLICFPALRPFLPTRQPIFLLICFPDFFINPFPPLFGVISRDLFARRGGVGKLADNPKT